MSTQRTIELEIAEPTLARLAEAAAACGLSPDAALRTIGATGQVPADVPDPARLLAAVAPDAELPSTTADGSISYAAAAALSKAAAAVFFGEARRQLVDVSGRVSAAYEAEDLEEPDGDGDGELDLDGLRRSLAALPLAEFRAAVFDTAIGDLFEWLGLRGVDQKVEDLQRQMKGFMERM